LLIKVNRLAMGCLGMSAKASDLESRAEALLKRIHRHNLGMDSLTAMEVQSLLKEIRAIGEMNLARSLPDDILARVDRIIAAGRSGRPAELLREHQGVVRRNGTD
jgi:hypothetical protein